MKTSMSAGVRSNLVIVLSAIGLGCSDQEQARQSETPLSVTVESDATHPFGRLNAQAPPETAQWGQLAGVWDCTLESTGVDGTTQQSKATWTWAYILDGYAVQDIYVGHRTDGRPDFYGTGVRIYNPTQMKWEIMWIANTTSDSAGEKMTLYQATYENEQIVMKYVDGDPAWRTVFFNIRDDTFDWRNEPSQAEMHCRRA